MLYDVCILSGEADFSCLLTYELEDRGLRVAQVCDAPAAAAVMAAVYLVDGDAFHFIPQSGRLVTYGRALSTGQGEEGEVWHRPFPLSALGTLLPGQSRRGLQLEPHGQAALLDGERIALTPREYACLACLFAAGGAPVSRADLLAAVWGNDAGDVGVVPVYLHYLRKKLERRGKKLIYVIRGRGYALRQEEEI